MFFTRATNFIKTQIDILWMKVEFAAFARTVMSFLSPVSAL